MESIEQTKKRKESHDDENEGRKFKKRSSGNARVAYLREKNEHLQEMHKEELEMKSYLACLRYFPYLNSWPTPVTWRTQVSWPTSVTWHARVSWP